MTAPETGDDLLASRLRLAVGRLHRRIRLASNDVPPLQLSTLASIELHGPLRLGELAQREAVSPPTMSRVLAALDERGLIARAPDRSDARSTRVTLSDAGRRALAEIRGRRTALLDARLARLDPDQRAALRDALPALEALVEDPPRPDA
ncbi:MarR family winged helix-turn-helix transcriptional regulator [Plantactinospora sp. KBS50]|uniref:MarR family winged helix-turn-helix transcriptional regulator n=1 Tax=Plantactinospora sp. KBS50 TaxID=2024580 RepID=UPI000BAA9CA8|nr:MarR family transcriptional regulator [Plantactinospora sp. KBS50]ASW55167.1 MarR family transcriptional regulator [Plantactinospora sp. KBS50]